MESEKLSHELYINELKDNLGFTGYSVVYFPKENGVESRQLFIRDNPVCKSRSECEQRLEEMTKKWINDNF